MVAVARKVPPAPVDVEPANDTGFADLAKQAATIDAGGSPDVVDMGPTPPAVEIDPAAKMAEEFFSLLKMPRGVAAPKFEWWPEFKVVWGDDQLRNISIALAQLCVAEGWSLEDLMGKYGPWFAVGLTIGLPSYMTWQAIKDRRAALEREAHDRKQHPVQ